MIIFRPPSEADLDHIAANMREMDVRECAVLGGHGPREALADGVAASDWAFVAEVNGAPVCAFGVASDGFLSDEGSPWMLGTPALERCIRELLLGTRAYLPRMLEAYQSLANYVHADNRAAIRYLKWCGFVFGAAVEIKGETFLPFSMRRDEMKEAA